MGRLAGVPVSVEDPSYRTWKENFRRYNFRHFGNRATYWAMMVALWSQSGLSWWMFVAFFFIGNAISFAGEMAEKKS